MSPGQSLLPFLPAPVAVADPEGRAVYVNPEFVRAFDAPEGQVHGRPLAKFFAGGAREAVLVATARVCAEVRVVRFLLRESDAAYAVSAAPIEAEGAAVGLVFLFSQEPTGEQVLSFHREIQEPIDDLAHCLDSLLEQTGGRRAERFRGQVEEGLRALERVRKWSDELRDFVATRSHEPAARRCDALELAHQVGEAAGGAARRTGHALEVLIPATLPDVSCDGARLSAALVRFVRDRLELAREGSRFTWAAKALGGGVLLSFTEMGSEGALSFGTDDDTPPAALSNAVQAQGGSVARVADPVAGVTTTVHLPGAE